MGYETTATGATVTLSWTVHEFHVGERAGAMISLTSDGQFHRNGQSDDAREFNYAIDPPLEPA
jgi:hypothetical protein